MKKVSTLVGIIIIVAVAMIAFGGVFAYQYFSTKPAANQKQEILNKQFPLAGEPTNQTAAWKTYTNTKYGFSFQYPAGWSIDNKPPDGIMGVWDTNNRVLMGGAPGLAVNDLLISFCDTSCLAKKNLTTNFNLKNYIIANTYPEYPFYANGNSNYAPITTTINGATAYTWLESPVGDVAFYKVSIPTEKGVFDLEYFENPKPETQQIISTFKFTN